MIVLINSFILGLTHFLIFLYLAQDFNTLRDVVKSEESRHVCYNALANLPLPYLSLPNVGFL